MWIVVGASYRNMEKVRVFSALEEEIPILQQSELLIEAAAQFNQAPRKQRWMHGEEGLIGKSLSPVAQTPNKRLILLVDQHVRISQQNVWSGYSGFPQGFDMAGIDPIVLVQKLQPLARRLRQPRIGRPRSIERDPRSHDDNVRLLHP